MLAKHRFKIIIVAILIAICTAPIILGLDVDADFISLLDPKHKTVKDYNYLVSNFDSTDAFVLLVKNSETITNPKMQEFSSRLRNLDSVVSISTFDTRFLLGNKSDGNALTILLVKPSFKPTELEKTRRLSDKINAAIDESGLDVGVSGSYQVLIDSAHSVSKDMSKAAIITFLGISILLLIVLRLQIVVVIAIAGTLIFGLLLTLAITKLIFGKLNFLTATLPAVILGLGVDFSLHIIYSFNEKAKQLINSLGAEALAFSPEEIIAHAHAKTFRPLLIAASTTATAFLALCFAKSRGLFEMGLVGAIGIVLTFLAAIILLPVFLSYVSLKTIAKIRQTGDLWVKVVGFFENKNIWLAAVVVIAVIISVFYSSKVGFTSDQNKLVDRSIKSLELQDELLERFHFSPVPIIFISPDQQTESKKLSILTSEKDKTFGFVQSYSIAGIFNQNAQGFKGKDGSFITLAYPVENPFKFSVFEKIERVAEEIRRNFPGKGNIITGSAFLNFGLIKSIKADLIRCTVIAAILVFTMVYIGFTAVRKTVLSILPVALSIFLTVGLMGLLHINFNLMTVVILPLIIGAGIDDGVHLQYRWHIENKNINRAVSGIASAVVATTLTSMIAFGSFITARNPGFKELGLVASAGFGFCLMMSLVVMPCILDILNKVEKIPQGSN